MCLEYDYNDAISVFAIKLITEPVSMGSGKKDLTTVY